jgi:hypothetical protein
MFWSSSTLGSEDGKSTSPSCGGIKVGASRSVAVRWSPEFALPAPWGACALPPDDVVAGQSYRLLRKPRPRPGCW